MPKVIHTYSFSLYDQRFFELAKEAGEVYSRSLFEFWKVYDETGVWLSKFDLQKHMKDKLERKLLHSDSFLGAMQQVHSNLSSWKQAKKVVKDACPPIKAKFLQAILFKKSQIKYKNGFLRLTLGSGNEYLNLKWSQEIPVPVYGRITYFKTRGWKINLCLETEIEQRNLDNNKFLSIDLGVKRIATLFDGKNTITLSGKKFMGLMHYRNKLNGKTQSILSKKKKTSNNYKKIQRAKRRATDRLLNTQKDMLHKYSSFIVDYAIQNNIGNIIIGDNVSTHNSPNLGKNSNQKISQNPEQKLKNYIKYKFERISGQQVQIVPEPYTSRTCPCCKNIKKSSPKGRTYKCEKCDFVFDRDGVGAINIYNENVSFGIKPGRIRSLTEPIGMKFHNEINSKSYVVAA